jgi:hypothetical protein
MRSDPRDDFSIFAGREHMFFGLTEPFAMIREEIESSLRKQVADVVVERIAGRDEPKFLTLGKKIEDGSKMIVTAFAFAFSSTIDVSSSHGKERLDATVTFLFRDVDKPGSEKCRTYVDLNADAPRGLTEVQERFLAFRYEASTC